MELLCSSANGKKVYYDPINSHAATRLKDTPQLRGLVIELVGKLDLHGDIGTHVDMGRVVGTCDVVDVDDSDQIVYGLRKNRDEDGLVPFTKSRPGDPCRDIAVHLVKQPNDSYILSSTWIGTFDDDDEPFPSSPNANERSVDFWNKHAFVYGSQEIQAGTETTKRPW